MNNTFFTFRFWYESPSTFTLEQLNEIKKSSLSTIICDNGDNITQVTNDLFVMPANQSPNFIDCKNVPRMDLKMWMQCPHEGNGANFCPA